MGFFGCRRQRYSLVLSLLSIPCLIACDRTALDHSQKQEDPRSLQQLSTSSRNTPEGIHEDMRLLGEDDLGADDILERAASEGLHADFQAKRDTFNCPEGEKLTVGRQALNQNFSCDHLGVALIWNE